MAVVNRRPAIAVLTLLIVVIFGIAGWFAYTSLMREDLVAAAEREGVLEIWSTTDRNRVDALLADFSRLHPRIKIVYSDVHGSDLQRDFLRAARNCKNTADLLWSSAMDLQIKLVNDGYASTYASPEAASLPDWARWKDQAWGITAEPIAIVYNKRLIARASVPTSHIALRRFLESGERDPHRAVATYDIARSAVGYLYLSQDEQASGDVWPLVAGMARHDLQLYVSAEDILKAVSSGRAAIGYNIARSYALDEVSHNPDLGIIMPRDYTLVMSRIAVIPRHARHPAAARLFLDYLLSRSGQRRLAERHITPARDDVALPPPLRTPGVPLRSIRVGPVLLVSGDRLTRDHFLSRWREALNRH